VSEWNLSVRLTGQGSDLKNTLSESASEASKLADRITDAKQALTELRAAAANNINIRLDIDGDHLRSDVSAALTTAGAGQGIGIRLDVDAGHLRDDVNAALTTAGAGQGIRVRLDLDTDHLRDDVNAALTTAGAGQGLGVNLTLTDTMQLRRDVQNAVRWAAWGHRIEIPIGLRDPNQLRRDVSAAVRRAQLNQRIRIRVDADTSSLRTLTRGLSPGGGGGGAGGDFAGALKGLLTLAPAAIPLAAGLAANMAPLAAGLAASGAAAGAFGIALAGQIGPLGEAADAEKKYQDAVTQHGANSQQAMQASLAYQRQLDKLPPATQKAAAALSNLKSDFHDWSDDLSKFTMEPVTRGLQVLDQLLPRLTPEVVGASKQLDRLVTIAGGAISTPGFDALSDKFADFSNRQLQKMTSEVIHFLRVLSEGQVSGPLAQFIDYAKENGPAAREAIHNIADAVGTLMEGASQAGPGMLALVNAAAKLVAALPPEVVAIILQVAAALKLMKLAGKGWEALSGGIGNLSTQIRRLAATSAAAGGGLAGLRAALASLSTGAKIGLAAAGVGALVLALHELSDNKPAVQVDALSTSLNTLISTGKVTGALKTNFNEISDSIAMVSKGASDNKLAQWTSDFGTWVGIAKGPGISTARENVDAWDKSMADLVKSGHPKEAAAQYDLLKRSWKAGGGDVGRLKKFTDDYNNALADQRFEAQMTAQSMGIFGKASQDTQAKLDAQKQSADGLRASIVALNDVNRSAYDAQIGFEASLDSLTASFKEHGATLNLDTEAGRANGQAMSAAAKSQDEMIASGLAAGESLGSMTKKSDELRSTMMRLATDAFDGNKKKATEYVNTLLGTPGEIKTLVKLERENAIAGLKNVQAEIQKTPNAKTVTVDTLNGAAIKALEAVGLKTRQLPDGRTQVYTANGQALGNIGAVLTALNNLDGKRADTYVTSHFTSIYRVKKIGPGDKGYGVVAQAQGGLVDYYANGGIQRGGVRHFARGAENHVAQIAPGGSWRVWAEDETQGESYIPLARSKRPRSRRIAEETVRRLGGDPRDIQWNANGNVTNWRYDPTTGSLYSASDAGSAGHKTKKVKVKGKHGKTTTKEVEYFDVTAVEKKIKSAAKATTAWNKDLGKVADRVGGDVAEALAAMGEDGMKLAHKMATGSTKYINDMAKALRDLQKTAKASLTDYTRQLSKTNTLNKEFSDNLAKLAAEGYGDLAAQLAAQNDAAAQQLAASAVKDKGKASKANKAAKTANTALTADQVSELVSIIAAIKNSKTGIHDVAATTELGEDEIITVASKAKGQISKSLGSRATRFLTDLGKANKGLAYANGGIRAGMYATSNGIIRFAEPSTGGEAYIPLGQSKRRSALPVLTSVASRFGVGLSDAHSATPKVIIIRQNTGPAIGTLNVPVTQPRATATAIADAVGYQVRRTHRGGVNR